ncbi:MAG: hypothetical protein OEY18_05005 [Candidatus Aminicenantes bacterium]|nr:hypothetical protein [Candidatus Aminicenantes bacterium]MDH5384047.1 hypothetical protein [Candidatus Aminicenantes bacterium]MDH5742538.1 hypothetical protein [Candidatus Aminicenantes bacterium]
MRKGKWLGFLGAGAVMVLLVAQPANPAKQTDPAVERIKAMMTQMNQQLKARGENVRIGMVEYITAWDKAGQTVYFDDRYLQLGHHWIPFDPYRYGVRDIFWLSDLTEGTANGLSFADTQAALARAMATWDSVNCAFIPLVQLPDYGMDWGYVQYLVGMGGFPGWFADITQAGWLPGSFFDLLWGPGASDVIIGVTFTFWWVDSVTGEPTDMDNNKKLDVAFREIYYNNNFPWGIDTGWPVDVETIVLHETGHGLSLGHFGKLFQTDANGKLHFAPRALMNAGYTGVQQEINGTDNAAFCSIWAKWPNK